MPCRLALAYAPDPVRTETLALLALDARLAGVVRVAREPVLGQLRLGWWRETLARAPETWPGGEPLLRLLRGWAGETGVLTGLVDGWEEMLGEAPLHADSFARLAEARADAFAALARLGGCGNEAETVRAVAREWALCDLALHVGQPGERDLLTGLVRASGTPGARLPRQLRPLLVLHGLARRAVGRGPHRMELVPSDMLFAMRLGLLGC